MSTPPRKTADDFDPEVLRLFDKYVHGDIDRRGFLLGAARFAAGATTAAGLLASLTPQFAMAQQVKPDDRRLKAEYLEFPSPDGYGTARGYLVRPAKARRALPVVLVAHENRGLNPHIEDIARRFAVANFMAFAPDGLTSVGGYPGDDERGGQLFGKVDRPKMTEDLYASAMWLKNRPDSTGRIGVTGFCFGGGISNQLAVRMGADLAAAVPFYGGAPPTADVPKIRAAVLVHHGSEDTRLVMAWPEYENALKAASVTYEGYIYPNAVHGFNNDATPQRFNKAASDLAMQRTIAWFNKYVRGGGGTN